jgi:aspartate-semialdehyde dehydrogenase
MSADPRMDVAVVGASSLIGAAVIEEIRRSKLPVGRVLRLEELRDIGRLAEDDESGAPALDAASFDFSQVGLAFFCCRAQLARSIGEAAARHTLVIDGSGAFRDSAAVPLAAADVNPQALNGVPRSEGRALGMVALPCSAAVALATAVAPLHALAGIERLDVATYHSVSGGGRAQLEELARECASLLNGQEPRLRAGAERLAFNVIPQVDQLTEAGQSLEELRLQSEVGRLLGMPRLAVNATAVRVPVFFGHGLAVHAQFSRELAPQAALEAWRHAPGIGLPDPENGAGYATPGGKSTDADRVYVGRLRRDSTRPASLNFWVVADNVRKCAAINAVSVAHILVNRHC